ncbi:3',5'-cyclic AMP phosphodiesterase CpdA [Cohnella sp. OV330]|uniref:S-layer homology domain-containing protein n=1 Tax=Cohnella sp. OV330 TaxID=1855288 RepID=UPI0008ED2BDB|nr:S-layer homology domain-containing protein [Cohnella sp. OV330]SFA74875.1 3',5'-cyclic AMP phosphodiesterase CpdA [Cohnella sp. OV330]
MRKSQKSLTRIIVGSMAVLLAVPFAVPATAKHVAFAAPTVPDADGVLMLEDFESGNAGVVKLNPKRVVSAGASIETEKQHVRNGNYSLRIDYDMIDVVDNPSQLELAPGTGSIAIQGKPIKVGLWAYGSNDGHLLTTKFRDSKGSSFTPAYYADDTVGVNWTGWKYIEVDVPQDKIEGSSLELYFQLKQSDMSKKNKGSIWIDDVQLIYKENALDREVPAIEAVSPAPNAVLTSDLDKFEVRIQDVQAGAVTPSGIDPSSISLSVDGQDLTAQSAYSEETKLLSLPAALITSGYHEVVVAAKDQAGNPARLSYSFTEDAGERLVMSAPAEAVSNELYEVTVSLAGDRTSSSSKVALQYDPGTLTVEQIVAKNGTTATKTSDNDGKLLFDVNDIKASGELATVQFRVSPDAVLSRGERFKLVKMSAGSLVSDAATVSSLAQPVRYTIAFPYLMTVEGVGLNSTSTFKVTTHDGTPFAGADVYLRGMLEQMAVVKLSAQASVYEDDDTSEPVVATLPEGTRIYGTPEADDGWFEVMLPDGATTGYVEETSVDAASIVPLNLSLGQTDEKGELKTNLTTLALGSYKAQAVVGSKNSAAMSFEVVEPYGSLKPEYIQTYVTEDLSTQLSVGWTTSPMAPTNAIQYVKAADWAKDAPTPDASKVTTVEAESANQVLSELENGPKGEIRFNAALIGGLSESTAYKYRVGSEGAWSDWYDYATTDAKTSTPVSFVFVTDSHVKADTGKETYQSLVQNALEKYPDTQFLMHGGDAVDVGGAFAEWKRFWEASASYATFLPSATTLGNHDVKGEGKEVYAKGASLPDNGPDAYKEYAYAYDVDDTHFVVLNSEGTKEQMALQAEWLRKDLDANKKKWTIAMFHRPVYHTEAGRGNLAEDVKIYFADILESHKVDLVLVGHDHVYARTYPMAAGKIAANGAGTVYLDGGSSGWKFYDGEKYDYLNFSYDDDVPVYTHVRVADDAIKVEARTLTGELVDSFAIAKTSGGTDPGTPGTPGPSAPNNQTGSGETNQAVHELTEKELQAVQSNGELTVKVSGAVQQLKIDSSLLTKLAANKVGSLVIQGDNQPGIRIDAAQLSAPADGSDLVLTWKKEQFANAGALKQLATAPNAEASGRMAFTVSTNGKAFAYTLDWKGLSLTPYTNLYLVTEGGSLELAAFSIVNQKQPASLNSGVTYTAIEVKHGYSDLAASHWSYPYVQMLSGIGVMQGTGNGQVSPDKKVTRAEFTAMIARALGLQASGAAAFADVKGNAWYGDAVAAAAQSGIVMGDRGGRFNPNADISRQEMAVMLQRALDYRKVAVPQDGGGASFGDQAELAAWARDAALALSKLGVMEGDASGSFNPLAPASRAETAKVISLLLLQ